MNAPDQPVPVAVALELGDDPVEVLRVALAAWDASGGLVLHLWPVIDAARAVGRDT